MKPIIRPLRRADAPWQQPATLTIARMFRVVSACIPGEAGAAATYHAGRALAERALDVEQLGGFDRVDAAAKHFERARKIAQDFFRNRPAPQYPHLTMPEHAKARLQAKVRSTFGGNQ